MKQPFIPKIYYTDGGTSRNGDFGNQSSVICASDSTGKTLFFKPIGDKTNNEAELLAILELLQTVRSKRLTIKSDSQLAVNLITKRWFTDIERLKEILRKIWVIEKNFVIEWIPREENRAGWYIEQQLGL